MSFADELARELAAVGIRGRLRRRILAEVDDHLRSGGDAGGFGAPAGLAARFAAELAPSLSRRGAAGAFAALAVAAGVYGYALVGAPSPADDVGLLPAAVAIAAAQVAFACGSLALLRALRRPGDVEVVGRRAALALGSGLVALGAAAYLSDEPALCGAAGALLLLALPRTLVAARLHAPGAVAGDLRDDLGVPFEPARIALAVAALCAGAVLVAGLAASDPLDGVARALAEAAACLAGFAVLGKAIGLRR